MNTYAVPVYTAYLVTTVGLVVWLARTLYRNGAVFLRDVFDDRPELAEAVNHLLVTGFAMVNLGYGFFLVNGDEATDAAGAFQVLARKLGILLLSLATVHFVNLFVFHRIAARRHQAALVPPVAPQLWVDDPDHRPAPPAPPARPAAPARPAPPAPAPRPVPRAVSDWLPPAPAGPYPPVPGFGPTA